MGKFHQNKKETFNRNRPSKVPDSKPTTQQFNSSYNYDLKEANNYKYMEGFVNKVNNNMQWQMSSFSKEADIIMKIMDMNKDRERKQSTVDSGLRRESAAHENE